MQYNINHPQEKFHQQPQYGVGNRPSSSAYRNSQSLFLDVIDDNARWKSNPVQSEGSNVNEARPTSGFNFSIFGNSESTDAPPQSTISSMMARGNIIGLDRALPAYDVVVVGVEERKEDGTGFLGLKGSYIGYILQTTRLRDSTVALTCKRYSAIRSFFEDLLSKGAIPKYAAPTFPPKETVGHTSDIQGSFIARRRIEIQSYLQRLFAGVPSLWELPTVKDFFALDTLRYGARYIAPVVVPNSTPSSGEGGWKPYTMASQAAAAISEKFSRNEVKEVVEANPDMVRHLCEMGFPERQVRAALEASKNDPNLATEYIMNGSLVPPVGGWDAPPPYPDQYTSNSQYPPATSFDWLSLPPPPPMAPPPAQSTGWFSRSQGTFSSLYSSATAHSTPNSAMSNKSMGSAGPGTVDV